ncbi:hypothetical protein [Pseudonocardia thermophila]|jgi:hypothetical protein|uniref:hypothetical protein n=1 Tax=Pseudonocardia thermophila TaxID=1848 RepID=UPI00248DEB8C|nr:hypothetical protein [Pseudonocardia thermophila]
MERPTDVYGSGIRPRAFVVSWAQPGCPAQGGLTQRRIIDHGTVHSASCRS